MAEIFQIAESFRAALLQKERAAAVRLVKAYGASWNRLSKELAALTKQIEDARARGEFVNQSWLFRQERYRKLIEQVTWEVAKFAEFTEGVITKEQRVAVKTALNDSQRLLLASAEATGGVSGAFNRLPVSAVENIVGFLGNGSPLNTLLREFAPAARQQVEQGLINAVAQGWNPRKTAKEIRGALGGNLNRALKIARTETIRAYREASHENYLANEDVLDGWVWLSARNRRTCPACFAMHGTFHPVTERMASHVNCRCAMVPWTKPIDGVPDTRPKIEPGEDAFAKLPAADQREVLGNAFDAYKAGKIKLTDLVGRKDSVEWGRSYHALPVGRALAGEGQFPGYQPTPKQDSGLLGLLLLNGSPGEVN